MGQVFCISFLLQWKSSPEIRAHRLKARISLPIWGEWLFRTFSAKSWRASAQIAPPPGAICPGHAKSIFPGAQCAPLPGILKGIMPLSGILKGRALKPALKSLLVGNIEHRVHLFTGDEHAAGLGAVGFGNHAAALHFVDEAACAGVTDAHAALEHGN